MKAEDGAFYRDGLPGANPDLVVSLGENVRLNLEVINGTHDWVVDEFDVATRQIGEGESHTVEFLADERGEFEYYSSTGSYREEGMYGTLKVQ
ncbi:hypothetical protein QA596_12360 [Balneolales bacterium ANBcel1]|nr:hypothetical protein [Balneolales bacterium ANBcel1]